MGGKIEITGTDDMLALQAAMEQVENQAIDVEMYADKWVCQKAGFEPSDICVLRPLAAAMDAIKEGFDTATTTFMTHWADVRTEVARTTQDFERQEDETVLSLNVLKGEVEPVRLPNGKVMMP